MALSTGWIVFTEIVAGEAALHKRFGLLHVSSAILFIGESPSERVWRAPRLVAIGAELSCFMAGHAFASHRDRREVIESPGRWMRTAGEVDSLVTFIAGCLFMTSLTVARSDICFESMIEMPGDKRVIHRLRSLSLVAYLAAERPITLVVASLTIVHTGQRWVYRFRREAPVT